MPTVTWAVICAKKQFQRDTWFLIEGQKVNPHDCVISLLAKTDVLNHYDLPPRWEMRCDQSFIAVLFRIAKDQKQYKCPSKGEKLDKQWNILQKNEDTFYVWVWNGLQNILSEIKQNSEYCAVLG